MEVPFGSSPKQVQKASLKFILDLIGRDEMRTVSKIFFVPVGLPGMGKSTLAKNIRLAVEENLSGPSQSQRRRDLLAQDSERDNRTQDSAEESSQQPALFSLAPVERSICDDLGGVTKHRAAAGVV